MVNYDFINEISKCAMRAYATLGKVKPSVCIAMAIVECAWGTAGSVKYHSYLGHKRGTGKTATKYWSGKSFSARTKECYDQSSGNLVTIRDSFRCYDSMEQCVFNFYELLNTSIYARVTDCDPYDQIQQIKDCGYMTSVTEVNTVRKLIEQYNLTQYDGVQVEAKEEEEVVVDYGVYATPKFSGVVELCNFIGIDSSFDNRSKLAARAGIKHYEGTAEQNAMLMYAIAKQCLNAACSVIGR